MGLQRLVLGHGQPQRRRESALPPWPPDEPHPTFVRALGQFSTGLIAAHIGLHENTVRRWTELRRVPTHYLPDLRRLLQEPHEEAEDQYFTRPSTAQRCFSHFAKTMAGLDVSLAGYTFIEPSMGEGCFYSLLPQNRRVGIDIAPTHVECIKSDYLCWTPPGPGPYVVIGNPPFGLRGHLALQFINHSAPFADAVGFILPQNFGSDGKGAPGKRVKGYTLASEADLTGELFGRPDGANVKINTIFQVWTKVGVDRIALPKRPDCSRVLSVYSLSDGGTPSSTRNKVWIGRCDVYLPSTAYGGMRAYRRFRDLPNQRGYGVVIHREKAAIKRLLMDHDWESTCFPSTNSAVNLRKSLIESVVIDAGFVHE